jgi:hypothetical protein
MSFVWEKIRQLDPSPYSANAVEHVAMMNFAKKSCNDE